MFAEICLQVALSALFHCSYADALHVPPARYDHGISDIGAQMTYETELWDGIDIGTSTNDGKRLVQTHTPRSQFPSGSGRSPNSSKIPVQIFGQFNTGTNLLMHLLELNFPELDVPETGFLNWWKHSNLNVMQFNMTSLSASGGVALAMVKDPLSWLQGLRKASYNLRSCVHEGYKDPEKYRWLNSTCATYCGPPNTAFLSKSGGVLEFADLESVWTNWTEAYGHLGSYGVERVLVIRYEDLVLDPEGVLKQIAKLAGLKAPKVFHQQIDAAKAHGYSNGREEALLKIKSKSYLEQYTEYDLNQVCERLGAATRHLHQYNDCDGVLSHSGLAHSTPHV